MKYRIVTAGDGFVTQCRFKCWPFWTPVFDPGFNYFTTVEKAEVAILKVIRRAQTDGRVAKEIP